MPGQGMGDFMAHHDRETGFGRDWDRQQAWKRTVEAELRDTAEFAADRPPVVDGGR